MIPVQRLYGRPLAADDIPPPLLVTGQLEGYTPGDEYEGRLQISGNIGKCRVEMVEQSLPPGAYCFVDNFTNEIVLKWPPYTGEFPTTAVPNGDFEGGDNGQMVLGPGWTIDPTGGEGGGAAAKFLDFKGISAVYSAPVPYDSGTFIQASIRFAQGLSGKGSLVGRLILMWCDANGNLVPGGEDISWSGGNLIRQGAPGQWLTSSAHARSNHPNVATVRLGFSINRKRQNHPAWVDNFTWDHEYIVGSDLDLLYTVTFKVTDSANRVAYWAGTVDQFSVYATSRPYSFLQRADVTTSPEFKHVGPNLGFSDFPTATPSPEFVLIEFREPLVFLDNQSPGGFAVPVPEFVEFVIKDVVVFVPEQDPGGFVVPSAEFIDMVVKNHPVTDQGAAGYATPVPEFVSMEFT